MMIDENGTAATGWEGIHGMLCQTFRKREGNLRIARVALGPVLV